MSSQERYLNKQNWGEIERGYEFDAAMLYTPSDTSRPLTFFIPDRDTTRGHIETKIGDFSPHMDSSGRLRATEQLIITPIKPRKVIVASDNFINQNGDFDYIIVYPIHTIHDSDKHKKWYKDVKEDKHPFFIYLPNVKSPSNIIERYVDVSQLISVHKGILLRKHNEVDPHKMLLIEERTLTILSLGEQESEIEQDSSKPAVNE